MSAENNLQRLKTLDDAWNAQDWEVFNKRHSTDTAVFISQSIQELPLTMCSLV